MLQLAVSVLQSGIHSLLHICMADKQMISYRQKCEVLVDENRQLSKDMQELETELFQVRIPHGCLQVLQ